MLDSEIIAMLLLLQKRMAGQDESLKMQSDAIAQLSMTTLKLKQRIAELERALGLR